MSAVKDIKVTEDFLGLNEDTKKCQSKETYKDCTTRNYLHAVVKKCNCVPYGLKYFTLLSQVFSKHESALKETM